MREEVAFRGARTSSVFFVMFATPNALRPSAQQLIEISRMRFGRERVDLKQKTRRFPCHARHYVFLKIELIARFVQSETRTRTK